MEVYTSQPNCEVLNSQQHVVPNLKLHHHHHPHLHQLPKIHISKNPASAAPPTEMKRSYEKTKESKQAGGGSKCSVIRHTNINTSSLPMISPCHKSKMAEAAAAAAAKNSKPVSEMSDNNNGAGVVERGKPEIGPSTKNGRSTCDVFLGGSCNPTTWRTDTAIPLLKEAGITYYNPQVSTWCPKLIALEHEAKSYAKCLLFVIDNQTRAVVTMIEVAFLAAQGRRLVLVLPTQDRRPGQAILGEAVCASEFDELTSAHFLLKQLVERHAIPVFNTIEEAVPTIAKIVRGTESNSLPPTLTPSTATTDHNNDITIDSAAANVNQMETNLMHVFNSLTETNSGEMKYSNIPRAYKSLTHQHLTRDQIQTTLTRFPHQRSSASNSSSGSTSSGEESPPYKKDLRGFTNGNAKRNSAEMSFLNFDEYKYCMGKLLNEATTAEQNNCSANFVQNVKFVLDKLLDDTECEPCPVNGISSTYDVYIGGLCDDSSDSAWKTDKAIPLLKKHNLSHCSPPSSSSFDPRPIDDSRVLFLYLNSSSRAVELMTLASYYMGLKRHLLVFCIQDIQEDVQTGQEKFSSLAVKDYNRGRAYISDIANRNEFSVFAELDEALAKVLQLCTTK